MSIFMDELRKIAQEYKLKQQEFIDRIAETDLAYIESMGGKVPAANLPRLRTNLEYIANRYEEMRIINHFVDFCDVQTSTETLI